MAINKQTQPNKPISTHSQVPYLLSEAFWQIWHVAHPLQRTCMDMLHSCECVDACSACLHEAYLATQLPQRIRLCRNVHTIHHLLA